MISIFCIGYIIYRIFKVCMTPIPWGGPIG